MNDFIHTQQSFWTQYKKQEISVEKAKEISENLLAFSRQLVRMNKILKESEEPIAKNRIRKKEKSNEIKKK
jgi:hypothetical protein